ncbi:CHASE2 domain-containing protein [Azospirillum canadense]|uniref:CHASE2 domain-containing protein n=1 Tax=Azospirillum canadense TaxID=403962 RepID=UPI002227AF91|nr:adenylate/guanylate cyclase domain-containing protein [Azospirillum canadense]MCW2239666.1 adenylate cyclase [Azospirillum canadense]
MRDRIVPSLLIGQAAVLAVVLLHLMGWLQPLDLLAYDTGLRSRARPGADERIVLVGAREADLAALGWPLSDAQLANLLNALSAAKPAAIGVDIYRNWPIGDGKGELEQALRANPDIVWVNRQPSEAGGAIPAPSALATPDRIGFSDILVDPDGVVRRSLLFVDDGSGQHATALSLVMALRLLRQQGIVPRPDPADPAHLRLGAVTLRPLEETDGGYGGVDARGYQFLLDYALGPGPIRDFSVRDALDGRIPAEALAGRLVFVAVTADSVKDYFRTPVDAGFAFGAVVHAQATSQLLRMALGEARPMLVLPDGAEVAVTVVVGLAASLLALAMHGPAAFALLLVGGTAALSGLWFAALTHALWMPLAAPLASWALALGLVTAFLSRQERADREALMRLFASHVPGPVAQELWERRHLFMDGGRPRPQRLTATVLFSDVANFTPISEKMEPEELDAWLHDYMGAMVPVIQDHGGLPLRFVGDAILSVFGVPVPRETEEEIDRDAANAVCAALAMADVLARLNAGWAKQGLPPAGIRVGLYTGPMVAGSIGAPGHMEYSLTGDAVNTAARLEALAKTVGTDVPGRPCRILVGDPTWERLRGAFRGAAVGEVPLKGKDRKVGVHVILGEAVPSGSMAEDIGLGGQETGGVERITAPAGSSPLTSDKPTSDKAGPIAGPREKGATG